VIEIIRHWIASRRFAAIEARFNFESDRLTAHDVIHVLRGRSESSRDWGNQ
jgi:hypothetical protein